MLKVDKKESEPLSTKEVKALIALAQRGNINARKRVISHNFRFVAAVVSSIVKDYDDPIFDDLIQEGIIGLDKAISRFDLSKSMKFSTYAVWWIRHSVGSYYRANMSLIRLPDNIAYFLTNKKNRAKITEVQTIGGESFLEVLGVPQADCITKALNLKQVAEENKEGDSIFDSIPSPQEEESQSDILISELDTSSINSSDLEMLEAKFSSCKSTYRDIAKIYGISHERVRQRIRRALDKLRENNKNFLSF